MNFDSSDFDKEDVPTKNLGCLMLQPLSILLLIMRGHIYIYICPSVPLVIHDIYIYLCARLAEK